ncbi:MAG TPA: wax ester/triacylglycerol synthase family O-acyltransferase [Acidimicrobiales bacterium]|nr:wax ester/triacylglycerol synthase family O-acyltransferase [Acidimicrobiales bacterium]
MTHDHALSPLDAAFLHVETEYTPMHMASIGLFEGAPLRDRRGKFRLDDVRQLIGSRLDLVPKLRQKAFNGLLGEAPPVWLDHLEFDIAEHVRICSVPSPGTEAELRELCAELLSEPLDRVRPLWELVFVDGLADGRIAVLEKLHHSMADGLAAAELATVLLDLTPEPVASGDTPRWEPYPRLTVWRAAVDDLVRLGGIPLRVASWGVGSVTHPVRRAKELFALGRAVSTIANPRIIAPRSSLNRHQISAARSVEFVRLPFADMHEVAHAFGATVNDVLLTLVAGGLHALLEGRGELDEKSELQVLVPVGLTDPNGRGLGNKVSALFVRLPVGFKDPLDILHVVSAEVRHEKQMHQELAASTMLGLLEPLPQGVLAVLAGVIQHQPFFNLIVTNVPGPSIPLYALGAKMVEAFPIVPLAGNLSLGVAALSYEGQLNLGILSDPVTCPDVELFCEGVRTSLRGLVDASKATVRH